MTGSARLVLKENKTNSDGNHPIYLRVIVNRKTKYFSLGSKFACKPIQWNDAEQIFRKNFENYKHANRTLSEKKNKADKILFELDIEENGFTIYDFELEFSKKSNSLGIIEYFDEIIEELKKQGSIGNKRVYKDTRNSISSYLKLKKKLKTADYPFENLDVGFLVEYESFLRHKHKIYKDEVKCEDSTIFIRMRTLRALNNKANKMKGIKTYPFKEHSISHLKTKTKHRALKEADLKKLFNLKYEEGTSLFTSLNYFRFMFMSRGMNFTDLANLKKTDITKTHFLYNRAKTHKDYNINLSEDIKQILDYYINKYPDNIYVFPILDKSHDTIEKRYYKVQRELKVLNKDFKTIIKKVNPDFNLTSYVSRHSFASILRKKDVSLEVIQELMGHADIETTKIYVEPFDEEILKESQQVAINAIK
jgi:site-specific recombinase XerD